MAHRAQEEWNGKDTHHKPQYQEEANAHDRLKHLPTADIIATGDGTQHHHHDDGKDVLQYQYRHHQTGELLLPKAKIVKGFIDNRRRRHGKHTTEEDTVHLGPSKELAYTDTKHRHAEDYRTG